MEVVLTPETVIDIFRSGIALVVMLLLVIITPGLCVSLIISFFQTITNIQDQTLSFIPKLLVTFVILMLCGSWLLCKLMDYTKEIFQHIVYVIG